MHTHKHTYMHKYMCAHACKHLITVAMHAIPTCPTCSYSRELYPIVPTLMFSSRATLILPHQLWRQLFLLYFISASVNQALTHRYIWVSIIGPDTFGVFIVVIDVAHSWWHFSKQLQMLSENIVSIHLLSIQQEAHLFTFSSASLGISSEATANICKQPFWSLFFII